MIKANELRIGNWVVFDNDSFPEQMRLESFAVLYKYPERITSIEPIPLTPEILEKAGFVESVFVDGDGDDRSVYRHEKLKDFFFNDSLEFDHHTIMVNEIKHLHQLQNLYFALTGTELQINL